MAKVTDTTQSPKLVKASARHLHLGPRKMRLVTNLVKGMNVSDALVQLQHANKKAAPMLIKLIQSAVANAKNNFSLSPEHLFIKDLTCDMGTVMKRFFPRARGSAFVIRHKMSHVNITLEERKQGKAGKSRLGLFKAREKDQGPKTENIDHAQALAQKSPKEESKPGQVFRTDEQRKMSKAQNKRRLFNRKSGV